MEIHLVGSSRFQGAMRSSFEEASAVQSTVTSPDSLTRTMMHQDGQLIATDGRSLAYRTTNPAGKPRAIVVMQQGTLGKPAYFDAMGEQLAASGIKSYALGSRASTPNAEQNAQDLQSLVQYARQQNSGTPLTVMGVSLGASVALDWSARFNHTGTPVVAMSPVILNHYLGLKDTLTVLGGFLSKKLARSPVATPMSAGKPLTTNPQAPEAHLVNPKSMTVPASLFENDLRMNVDVVRHGPQMKGPLFVAMAGNDAVAVNRATKIFSRLIHSSDLKMLTVPGAAHDLSQETNHAAWVTTLSNWILAQG